MLVSNFKRNTVYSNAHPPSLEQEQGLGAGDSDKKKVKLPRHLLALTQNSITEWPAYYPRVFASYKGRRGFFPPIK